MRHYQKVQNYIKWNREGARDLLLKFWDPLDISGMVEARNFKFGTHIDHRWH